MTTHNWLECPPNGQGANFTKVKETACRLRQHWLERGRDFRAVIVIEGSPDGYTVWGMRSNMRGGTPPLLRTGANRQPALPRPVLPQAFAPGGHSSEADIGRAMLAQCLREGHIRGLPPTVPENGGAERKCVTIRGRHFPSREAAAEHFGITKQAVSNAHSRGRLDSVGHGHG